MFHSLGVGGGGSLIAGVACLLAPIPFIFYKYGEPIRKRSRFAPTEPKKPEESEKKDEEPTPERRRSQLSTSDEEGAEVDEQAGVPSQSDVEKEVDKERSSTAPSPLEPPTGDRFLDASGMERAERT